MDLTERQKKILTMLKEKSLLSGDEIAQNLNITKSALRTDFSILTTLKLITSKQNKGYSYNNKCTIIKVRDCMSPQNSIDIRTSVYDAIIHLFNYDLGTLVVVENEKLVGIISRKDLLKATLNKKNIEKYDFWGLALFVGIPIPGTGAWTGAMVASLLKMNRKKSILAIFLGILLASLIMSVLSYGILASVVA